MANKLELTWYGKDDPDVIAKKKRGIQYCEVATRWGKANGYKEWRYLFMWLSLLVSHARLSNSQNQPLG